MAERDTCRVVMQNAIRTEVEHVTRRSDVKQALKQTRSGNPLPAKIRKADKLTLGIYALLFLSLLSIRFFSSIRTQPILGKLTLIALVVVSLLGAARIAEVLR